MLGWITGSASRCDVHGCREPWSLRLTASGDRLGRWCTEHGAALLRVVALRGTDAEH